jgi:hypothetical protein
MDITPATRERKTIIASDASKCHRMKETATGLAFWTEKITRAATITSTTIKIAIIYLPIS